MLRQLLLVFTAWGTPHGQQFFAVTRLNLQPVSLLAGTAGKPFRGNQALATWNRSEQNRFEFLTEFLIGDHKEKGVSERMHGYYATLIGKTSGRWGPVLSYDSINDTEDVRVTLGGYYGKPNDVFRFLLNYEFRGAVDTGRLYLWTLVRI